MSAVNDSPTFRTSTARSSVFGEAPVVKTIVVSRTISLGGRTSTIRTWSNVTSANALRWDSTAAAALEKTGTTAKRPLPGAFAGLGPTDGASEQVATPIASIKSAAVRT